MKKMKEGLKKKLRYHSTGSWRGELHGREVWILWRIFCRDYFLYWMKLAVECELLFVVGGFDCWILV